MRERRVIVMGMGMRGVGIRYVACLNQEDCNYQPKILLTGKQSARIRISRITITYSSCNSTPLTALRLWLSSRLTTWPTCSPSATGPHTPTTTPVSRPSTPPEVTVRSTTPSSVFCRRGRPAVSVIPGGRRSNDFIASSDVIARV